MKHLRGKTGGEKRAFHDLMFFCQHCLFIKADFEHLKQGFFFIKEGGGVMFKVKKNCTFIASYLEKK